MTRILRSFSLLLLCLVLVVSSTNANNNSNNKKNNDASSSTTTAPPAFTIDTFLVNPAATDTAGMVNPLKLSLWTTPSSQDWSEDLVLRFKPLVARLGGAGSGGTASSSTESHTMNGQHNTAAGPGALVNFHPHQAMGDGSLAPFHCRPSGNPKVDITDLSDECLTECVNAGRYCALPTDDSIDSSSNSHAGVTGADIVLEQARRMCVWIVYGQHHDDLTKLELYFDYIQTIRDTHCDSSLGDSCVDHVYRQVGIDSQEISNCIHNAGGVGAQIDSHNALLKEEVHRAQGLPDVNQTLLYTASQEELPHVIINGYTLWNATVMSDWQLLAAVCTALAPPKPAVCDFCLLECPNGNENHDPTQQCLWDLTCGDDRHFDDWFHKTGVFEGGSNATNTNNATILVPVDNEDEKEPVEEPSDNKEDNEKEPEMTMKPTTAPTTGAKPLDEDISIVAESNSTMVTNSSTANTTGPPHETLKPISHTNQHKTMPPKDEPTAAPSLRQHDKDENAPTPAPNYASGPGYSQEFSNPPHAGNSNGGGHSSTGGSLAAPHKNMPQTGSSNQGDGTIGGLLVGIAVLGAAIAVVAGIQKYRTGKQYVSVIRSAERAEGGLATTASHAAENDLQLHVEMAPPGGGRSGGYAAPSAGTWG